MSNEATPPATTPIGSPDRPGGWWRRLPAGPATWGAIGYSLIYLLVSPRLHRTPRLSALDAASFAPVSLTAAAVFFATDGMT